MSMASHRTQLRWSATTVISGSTIWCRRAWARALDGSDEILKGAYRLAIPTLLYHGTEDTICDIEGSRQFSRLAPVGMVAFHEIMGGRRAPPRGTHPSGPMVGPAFALVKSSRSDVKPPEIRRRAFESRLRTECDKARHHFRPNKSTSHRAHFLNAP